MGREKESSVHYKFIYTWSTSFGMIYGPGGIAATHRPEGSMRIKKFTFN